MMRCSSFTLLVLIYSTIGEITVNALRLQRGHQKQEQQPDAKNAACTGITLTHRQAACGNMPSISDFLNRIDKSFNERGRKLPITEESIDKAWTHAFEAQSYRLQMLAQKIANGEDVHIMVVGGSFTYGSCETPWPAQLETLLRTETGRDNIKVTNDARGGSTTFGALHHWSRFKNDLPTADLVISEFNFNDAVNFGHPKKSQTGVKQANLEFASAILDLPHRPAFMYFDLPDWMHPNEVINSTARGKSVHYETAARMHVPLVWYSTAVKDSGDLHMDIQEHPPSQSKVHPKCFPAHEVVASLMYGLLRQRVHEVCEKGITQKDVPVPRINDATSKCLVNPSFAVYADDGESKFAPVSHTSGWSFAEDRPGKPGWLAEADGKQHEIEFDIPISKAVHIEYLRSYDNIGSATCFLKDSSSTESLKIEGLWNSCASLSDHAVMQLAAPTKKSTMKRLSCRSDGGKFKIMSIVSC